jgi:hypothetical protein
MTRNFNLEYVRNLVNWEELENLKILKESNDLSDSHLEAIFDQACQKESQDILIWLFSELKFKNFGNENVYTDKTRQILKRMKQGDFENYNTCTLCQQETNAFYMFNKGYKMPYEYPQKSNFENQKLFKIKIDTVYCSKCIHLLGEYNLIECPNCGTRDNIHLNITFVKDTCINPIFSGLINACDICDYHCRGCHKKSIGICKECLENSLETTTVVYRDGRGPRCVSRGYLGCQEKKCIFKYHTTTPRRV